MKRFVSLILIFGLLFCSFSFAAAWEQQPGTQDPGQLGWPSGLRPGAQYGGQLESQLVVQYEQQPGGQYGGQIESQPGVQWQQPGAQYGGQLDPQLAGQYGRIRGGQYGAQYVPQYEPQYEPQQQPERLYSISTSTARMNHGGSYTKYEIVGKQLITSYRNANGEEGTTTSNLTFTDWGVRYPGTGDWMGGYNVYYDAVGDEYYFSHDGFRYIYMEKALQALSEAYAPEHCLDLGVKNLKNRINWRAMSLLGCTQQDLDDLLQEIQDEAVAITENCTTDYDRTEALSRWMLDNIAYATDLSGYTGYSDEALANPYIVWKTGEAVCYGYAQLMEIMLQAAGVPSTTVRGWREGSHVWNMVYIDGEWMTLDPTNLKYWEISFLPDAEYAVMGLFPFYIQLLSNLIDGSNVYNSQVLRISVDMVKVTLEPNGGTVRIPSFYVPIYDANYKDYYTNLEDPVRYGYIFQGWHLQPDFKDEVNTSFGQIKSGAPAADYVLYAKWNPTYYYLTVDGGRADQPRVGNTFFVAIDATVTITAKQPEDGKRFDHWEVVSGDIRIADPAAATTTLVMPAEQAEVKAVYRDKTADDVQAEAVEDAIAAIGDPVTLADWEKIREARKAYEALTAAQKTLVSSGALNVLKAAEDAYRALVGGTDSPHGGGDTPGLGSPGAGSPPVTDSRGADAAPVKGGKYTVGKFQYKVTKPDSKIGEVTLIKPTSSKAAKAAVPQTVKINGRTFKVTAIGAKAFKNNKRLRSVTIGKNVKSIGAQAFSGCTKLKTVNIKGTNLKRIGANAFKNTSKSIVIKAPKSKLKTYKKLLKGKGLAKPAKITKA
jgi:uncharacterized repeat protein (TIGR02543 family)